MTEQSPAQTALDQLKTLAKGIMSVSISEGPDDTVTGGWRIALGFKDFEAPTFEEAIAQAYLYHTTQATAQALNISPVEGSCPAEPRELCEGCHCFPRRAICSRTLELCREVAIGIWQCKTCSEAIKAARNSKISRTIQSNPASEIPLGEPQECSLPIPEALDPIQALQSLSDKATQHWSFDYLGARGFTIICNDDRYKGYTFKPVVTQRSDWEHHEVDGTLIVVLRNTISPLLNVIRTFKAEAELWRSLDARGFSGTITDRHNAYMIILDARKQSDQAYKKLIYTIFSGDANPPTSEMKRQFLTEGLPEGNTNAAEKKHTKVPPLKNIKPLLPRARKWWELF